MWRGGRGGWYGGGGGGGTLAGYAGGNGGGGSGYVGPGGTGTMTAAVDSTPAGTSDPDYVPGVGAAGGGNGYVVIRW